MFSTLISYTLFFLVIIQSVLAEFTVDTPQISQCKSVQITWNNEGKAPFNLVVVPAEDPCTDAYLADLGADHKGQSMTWNAVNIAAGTNIMLSLMDADNQEAWSGSITVGASNDTSCLPADSQKSNAPNNTPNDTSDNTPNDTPDNTSTSGPPGVTLVPNAQAPAPSPVSNTAGGNGNSNNLPAAVPAGAANVGGNPFASSASGAVPSRQLPVVATAVGILAAVFAAVAL